MSRTTGRVERGDEREPQADFSPARRGRGGAGVVLQVGQLVVSTSILAALVVGVCTTAAHGRAVADAVLLKQTQDEFLYWDRSDRDLPSPKSRFARDFYRRRLNQIYDRHPDWAMPTPPDE